MFDSIENACPSLVYSLDNILHPVLGFDIKFNYNLKMFPAPFQNFTP